MENLTKERIEKAKIEMKNLRESNPQMSQFLSIEHGATVRTMREVKDALNGINEDSKIREDFGQYIIDCLNSQ